MIIWGWHIFKMHLCIQLFDSGRNLKFNRSLNYTCRYNYEIYGSIIRKFVNNYTKMVLLLIIQTLVNSCFVFLFLFFLLWLKFDSVKDIILKWIWNVYVKINETHLNNSMIRSHLVNLLWRLSILKTRK